jgi:nucleotide-binding universal stress UspA family protein
MSRKKILVPLWPSGKDLKGVHYALSLAERLHAQVYILQQAAVAGFENPLGGWLEEALLDLINSARQAGLTVSHHLAHGELEVEIVDLVKEEGIDVLVFGEDDGARDRLLLHVKPLVSSQIILVKEKNHIDYL